MKKFNELHFFIDESGDLATEPANREILLVGGVLLFGSYNDETDASLKEIISQQLARVGGKFPEDLHFSKSALSTKKIDKFFDNLSNSLKRWTDDQRILHGVYIKHKRDIFNSASEILSEEKFDNRYLSMLWSLVEHLVFVDEKVKERLTKEATIHLHIANRILFIDGEELEKKRDKLRSLGYHIFEAKWQKGSYYTYSLNERDLTTMVRMALRQRWNKSNIRFGSIDTSSIQYKLEKYNQLKPPMALYLADLFLGQSRSTCYSDKKTKLKQRLLSPAFRIIHYGPWLETLAQMRAALQANGIDAYFAAAETYYSFGHETLLPFSAIAERLTKKAAQLLEKDLDKLTSFMKELVKKVDYPGKAAHFSQFVNWLGKLIENCTVVDHFTQALYLQIRLSICNHTGDVSGANQTWEKFLVIEPELYSFGAEGLRVKSEMRNRRAVSLTDSFRYHEAENILLDIISLQRDSLQHISKTFGIDVKEIPSEELGACYGTLGQIYAFTGTNESFKFAETSFRQAISLFKKPADINRQWIYLGHLACDQGNTGTDLWREVLTHLPALGCKTAITGNGRQYELALQIKGLNVFGNIENKKEFSEILEKTPVNSDNIQNDFNSHPYGLIYQNLAMLYQCLWNENRESQYFKKQATTYYSGAAEVMKGKPGLLNILGIAAHLRKEIFEVESNNSGTSACEDLSGVFNRFKESLVNLYSGNVWQENGNGRSGGHFGKLDPGPGYNWVERAKAVLAGIRFNYW